MSLNAQQIVEAAIYEVNDDAQADARIAKTADTPLLGADSTVDSLSLVRLLVTVERLVEEHAGRAVVIVDESAFEETESPFATVGSLTRHVERLLAA